MTTANKINSYRDLTVWQKSMDLVVLVYKLSESLPSNEQFGLSSQIRRAVVSIPANISEGSRRGTKKDYRNFLLIAFGSGAELETHIDIAVRLGYVKLSEVGSVNMLLNEVLKMLNVIIKKLEL